MNGDVRVNVDDILGSDGIMELGKKPKLLARREPERYGKSQAMIDDLIERRLSGIHFSGKPVYEPRLFDNGRTRIHSKTGLVVRMVIGKQDKSAEDFLVDTLLHEELEARVARRAIVNKAPKFMAMLGKDKPTHAYIYAVIARYFRVRGWSK